MDSSSYMHLPNECDEESENQISTSTQDRDNHIEEDSVDQIHCDNKKEDNTENEDSCDENSPLLSITHHHYTNPILCSASSTLKMCPTCHGKGKLSQSDADKVVALIPATDKRLKPRRTELYLTLTAVLCILSGCLLVFFLWPRAIYVHVEHSDSNNIHIGDPNNTFIEVKVRLRVENENFFDASITNMNVKVTWNKVYTCNSTIVYFRPVLVNRGSPQNITFVVRQTFLEQSAKQLYKSCDCGWNWWILEHLNFALTVSMNLHPPQVVEKTHWARVLCYNATSVTQPANSTVLS